MPDLTVDEITTRGLLLGNADLAETTYEPPGEPERVPALVDAPKAEAFRDYDLNGKSGAA